MNQKCGLFHSTRHTMRPSVLRNAISRHKLFYSNKIRNTLTGTSTFLVQTSYFLHHASTSSDHCGPNVCPRTWNPIKPQQPPSSGGAPSSPSLFTAIVHCHTHMFIHFFVIYLCVFIHTCIYECIFYLFICLFTFFRLALQIICSA